MELNEVKELMNEIGKVIDIPSRTMWLIVPKPQVYDSDAEGYKLGIKQSSIKESSRKLLESIVEKHKLKMMKMEKEDLVIYTPRKA